jgi:hypothetical protein
MSLEERTRKILSGGGRSKPNATDKGLITTAKMLDALLREDREARKKRARRPH